MFNIDIPHEELISRATSKKGGTFNRGNVLPFARGGIVKKPTLFPTANVTGLIREAEPETIVPLERGKEGKLELKMVGAMR